MKLFVSVGTQLPFERLLNMVDSLNLGKDLEIIYQISESKFNSKNGKVYKYLNANDYNKYFDWCDVFISHAGMGSIITALENGKPIVICPRLFANKEHRNDHQLATVERFKNYPLIQVANDNVELERALKSLTRSTGDKVNIEVDSTLIEFLKLTIESKN